MNEMQQKIEEMFSSLLPNEAGILSAPQLRAALEQIAEAAYRQGRADAFLSLRTSADAARAWGVTQRRARAYIGARNARYGMGLRVGAEWLVTQEEIERWPPDARRTRSQRQPPEE